jgi:nucleoside-diphosphate-sugar epimerase
MKNTREPASFPARTVVLGCRGVIGKEIVEHIQSLDQPVLGVSSADLDLLDDTAPDGLRERLNPGDALVVCSALTPDKGRDIATMMKNLVMVRNVCAAIEGAELAQVIYLSSDAVYPFVTNAVDEETPAAPADLYGIMHRTREIMLAETVKDCPLAILRCTMVLAARDTHNSYGPNRFRRQAAKDGKIGLGGEGEETRDFIDVNDVARVVAEVLRNGSGGILNVATGVSPSFMEVARTVAECFAQQPEIATSERRNAITHRKFDITAIHRTFPGFVFKPLADAVQEAHQHDAD